MTASLRVPTIKVFVAVAGGSVGVRSGTRQTPGSRTWTSAIAHHCTAAAPRPTR